jgi:hypothetical protein
MAIENPITAVEAPARSRKMVMAPALAAGLTKPLPNMKMLIGISTLEALMLV